MPIHKFSSVEEKRNIESALRTLGIPVDAQFVGLAWGKLTGDGIDDWQTESVIFTPNVDPFLARAAGLTLSQDILKSIFARI